MAVDDDTFSRQLVTRLGEIAYEIALPQVSRWSRALAAAMKLQIQGFRQARLHIPQFWAVYVHDGRGPITAPGRPGRTTFLVWFRNRDDDPRGPTPERAVDVRHLTPSEWKHFIKLNRAAPAGQEPMIIAKHVGPVTARRFFANDGGMAQFHDVANATGKGLFMEHARESIGNNLKVTVEANLRLQLPFG